MGNKFEEYSGGMKLSALSLTVVVVLAIYVVTADASQWVQFAAITAVAVIAVLFIRISGIGRNKRAENR
ncbi:Putative membrane protein [Corynebacterium glyciniphilum AJ 3170]|uniref:Putative membrane protein n=1 Tax=Corynebacterium glyciniphilum AJ 3170 TaxID=1404245 RepID=X5E4S3_9CORY|nr:Putative membrane protein [Corynebacterium glyciniphilum AJ 3170]